MTDYDVELVIVAALDEERAIGRDGRLPWKLPADLRHFKETTMGHPLVMGRKTREAIGRALPGRDNIVLTRRSDVEFADSIVVHSLDEACQQIEELGATRAMIIGGASIFEQALPRVDRMVLTLVEGRHDGDTFFPAFQGEQWEIVDTRVREADEDNERGMVFVTLEAAVESPRTVGTSGPEGGLAAKLRRQLERLDDDRGGDSEEDPARDG